MKSILFATLFALCPLTATINGAENSDLRLAKIFTDNMVLQQQKPIAVWGWAKPGSKVSITLTQNPQLGEKAVTTYREQVQRPSAALRAIGEYSIKIQYVEKPQYTKPDEEECATPHCSDWAHVVTHLKKGVTWSSSNEFE